MNDSDVGKKAFTMAIFEGVNGAPRDEENCCLVCGKTAERMLRFTDFTQSEPLEMRWCADCWREYLDSGKIENPMTCVGVSSSALTPSFLITELSLTELPLPDALERLYGVCKMIRGGCIRCTGASDLPLVGPLKVRSQSLSNTLDCLLGPIGMQWEICRDVLIIAPSAEELETLKLNELTADGTAQM